MAFSTKSKTKAIKDVAFTDDHVWIYGTVKRLDGERLEINDGTGSMVMDIITEAVEGEGTVPTITKGKLANGVYVRVIGSVAANTDRTFTFTPLLIQNLDELGLNKDLLARVRSLEQQVGGDK